MPEGAPVREPIVIELEEPIEFGSEQITKLTMKPIKASAWWDFPLKNPTMGDFLAVAAKACGISEAAMRRLSGADVPKVVEAVNRFFPSSLATGERS